MASANIAVLSSFDRKGIDSAIRELDKLDKATKEASSSITDGLKRVSDKMTDVGKTLTAGVTLPIVGLGVVAGKWASDAAESANKVNVVFGEQAATILAWAKDSERAFGLSEGQANSFFGSVGTMLQGFGLDMSVIPDMSKSIVTLAADLGSFHNLDTAQVMDMISASFRGEYDSIQRVIPTINAAAVETKALAMTGKVAKDSLTAQEKALATYQLMLEGAGPATGDFARTQDGAANSTRIAMAQIRSAGETIGSIFLPIVSAAASKVAEWADKFANLDQGTQKIIVVVAAVAAALGPLLLGVGAVAKSILAVNAAMTTLAANPVVLAIIAITVAIAALVAGAVYAYNNFEWFKNAVDAAWDGIQAAARFAWERVLQPIWTAISWYIQNILIPYFTMLWNIAKSVFEKVASVVSWAWNNVIRPAWTAISWYIQNILVPYFTTLWNIAKSVFNQIADKVMWAWNTVIKPVWDAIYWYIENILIPYYTFLWNAVKSAFDQIATKVMWAWNNVIKPAWDAISWYISNILVPYFTTIWNTVRTVFDAVGSVISWVWQHVISPAFNRITGGIGLLISVFSSIKDTVVNTFSGIFDVIVSPIRNAINWVIRKWNGLEFNVPRFEAFGISVGGGTIGTPDIPEFATGGVFQAPTPGGAGLALLHDGEMILNARQQQQMRAGGDVNVYVTQSDASPYEIGREVVWSLRVAG